MNVNVGDIVFVLLEDGVSKGTVTYVEPNACLVAAIDDPTYTFIAFSEEICVTS